jgi:methylamine dehydrogenase heavy chain
MKSAFRCPVRGAARAAALAALALLAPLAAQAVLPVEQARIEPLAPADAYRVYLVDPAMGHLVDGRLHVIDGGRMKYLALIGTGFAGTTVLSRDRKTIFVATTYHSRLQRGTRSDVVEVYGSDDLVFRHEIEIPPKHVQGLQTRALGAMSADDRFLLLQNATPATSVSVVDVAGRRLAAEIETPGCYGVIAWPKQPRRFSAVCGDGTLATYELDDKGALASRKVSPPFFKPDVDPIFMHYELSGERLTFVSYHGQVYTIELGGDAPSFAAPWSMLDAATRKQGWRPGGYELFAVEGDRLYVAMHDHGAEGSHKNPAKEIWIVDLKAQRRVARMPGQAAVSMAIAHGAAPRLFVLSGADNRLLSWDLARLRAPYKPLARSEPFGETPVYLELH